MIFERTKALLCVCDIQTSELVIFVGNMDELNKYLKFLSLKFSQAIVQSRLGNPVITKCNASGTDWVRKIPKFNKIDFVCDKQRSHVYSAIYSKIFLWIMDNSKKNKEISFLL